jgi:hypothetical protein
VAAPLPPDLLALEQKAAALQITSLRFTVATKLTERHPVRNLDELFKAVGLDSMITGEETLNPPAANVTLGLFGVPLTFRIIGTSAWVYVRQLAPLDGGRPWVRLGPGGFAELVTIEGAGAPPHRGPSLAPSVGPPDFAQPPFAKLAATLAGASAVSELGAATVDGVPVTRFLATLRPGQLESRHTVSRSRQVIAVHHATRPRALRRPAAKPKLTLEVAFASTGMPVRIVLTQKMPDITTSATIDFPAVNFPLTITPPAAAETIGVAELKALEAKEKRRRAARHKHHKSKQ